MSVETEVSLRWNLKRPPAWNCVWCCCIMCVIKQIINVLFMCLYLRQTNCSINITRTRQHSLDKQLWWSRISLWTKLKLYNTCILPVFPYGSAYGKLRWMRGGSMLSTSGASICSLELNGITSFPVMKYNAEPINLHSLKSFRHGVWSCSDTSLAWTTA